MTSQRLAARQRQEQLALAHQWNSTLRPSVLPMSWATATSRPSALPSSDLPVRGRAAGSAQNMRGFGSSDRSGAQTKTNAATARSARTSRDQDVITGDLRLLA